MKITIVSGTNRPGANTRRVAGAIADAYETIGQSAKILDLADIPPSIFHPSSYAEKPVEFAPFTQTVLESDGLVIVSPEYNGGMPGVLKYFIDMLKFPESFENRPVCFVGLAAGMWGALRPIEQLQQIFGYRNAHIFPTRVFIPKVGEALDDAGRILDPALAGRIQDQASGFADFVRRLKN